MVYIHEIGGKRVSAIPSGAAIVLATCSGGGDTVTGSGRDV